MTVGLTSFTRFNVFFFPFKARIVYYPIAEARLLSTHCSVLQWVVVGGPSSGLALPCEASCSQIYFTMYRRPFVPTIGFLSDKNCTCSRLTPVMPLKCLQRLRKDQKPIKRHVWDFVDLQSVCLASTERMLSSKQMHLASTPSCCTGSRVPRQRCLLLYEYQLKSISLLGPDTLISVLTLGLCSLNKGTTIVCWPASN